MPKLAALLTCHNRRQQTLECLQRLFAQTSADKYDLHVILVDDGSTDGTSDAVKDRYPEVEIMQADGSLYWNRGMHLAFEHAMRIGFDAYLWLNDDTMLNEQAIQQLLQTRLPGNHEEVIVVGAVCDPISGRSTYGGARYIDPIFRPFLCEVVVPNGQPQEVDVMNGNVVLVPDSIARKLGNLDPVFEHAMGDTDYAMRARKLGIRLLITSNYVGCCVRNNCEGTHLDRTLLFWERLRQLFSRKGLPLRSWFVMCWRHGGLLWPIHFIWSYVRIIAGRI